MRLPGSAYDTRDATATVPLVALRTEPELALPIDVGEYGIGSLGAQPESRQPSLLAMAAAVLAFVSLLYAVARFEFVASDHTVAKFDLQLVTLEAPAASTEEAPASSAAAPSSAFAEPVPEAPPQREPDVTVAEGAQPAPSSAVTESVPEARSQLEPDVTVAEAAQPAPSPAVTESLPEAPPEREPDITVAEAAQPAPPAPVALESPPNAPSPPERPPPMPARKPNTPPTIAASPPSPAREAPQTAEKPSAGPSEPPKVAAAPAAPEPFRAASGYERTLLAWLERYREYPRAARQRRIEGRVVLRLRLEPSGRIAAVEILSSSGAEILDSEAVATMRRASPFPPLPAELRAGAAEFTLPVVFKLPKQ